MIVATIKSVSVLSLVLMTSSAPACLVYDDGVVKSAYEVTKVNNGFNVTAPSERFFVSDEAFAQSMIAKAIEAGNMKIVYETSPLEEMENMIENGRIPVAEWA